MGGSATGLLALSGALAAQAQLAAAAKEDRAGVEAEGSRGKLAVQGGIGRGGVAVVEDWQATLPRAPNPLKCEGMKRGLQGPFTSNWLCVLGKITNPLWAFICLVWRKDNPFLVKVLEGKGRF